MVVLGGGGVVVRRMRIRNSCTFTQYQYITSHYRIKVKPVSFSDILASNSAPPKGPVESHGTKIDALLEKTLKPIREWAMVLPDSPIKDLGQCYCVLLLTHVITTVTFYNTYT